MLKIGLTGGIGSGKSTVARIFEVLGIPVFYADDAAKKLMTDDAEVVKAIRENFGDEAYLENGQLNRSYIAGRVFNDEAQLKVLNGIVHPATFRAMDRWADAQRNVPYVVKEAALLFESGSYKQSDHTVLVLSPEALRIRRIMNRDGITEEQVRARMSKQMSDAEKEKRAGFTLQNDEHSLLIPQVLKLHERFVAESKA
ncbi:MAG: dephospho-CoA kinase [Mucilaginibacter polytrichastri]|nr:dephospho-CoA kinase [Mucilaginibacter polytrichastri]